MGSLTAGQVKLGFMGLDNMGSRIARRLLDHGYQLEVNDRDPAKSMLSVVTAAMCHLRTRQQHCFPSDSTMITKIYAQLHRETLTVAPQIDWSASIEKDIQCLS